MTPRTGYTSRPNANCASTTEAAPPAIAGTAGAATLAPFTRPGLSPGISGGYRINEKVLLTWEDRACLGSRPVRVEGTFQVENSARADGVVVSADGRGLVSPAGAVLLWETMR